MLSIRALAERFELGPDHVLGDEAVTGEGRETAVGAGDYPFAIAHRGDRAFQALGDQGRVLDIIGHGVDDAGDQHHVVGQRVVAKGVDLVGVARVGERQR